MTGEQTPPSMTIGARRRHRATHLPRTKDHRNRREQDMRITAIRAARARWMTTARPGAVES
jgi:hypothetical protein